MPNSSSPLLFFAAAGALIGGAIGATGGGWYMWQRGQQEAAKRLRHEDAIAAKEALEDEIEVAELRKKAKAAGLDPDQVIAGYEQLRDKQVTPGHVLEALQQAPITDQ
ncbi:hypothetical protein [Nocardioides sp. W7]|uniref:hypothetical protein n=1 Tax=Nocardioides sp. W7 TaxID=2931390 RepID=UPI001FD55442|nr:hypothetical protein [Nocardioides sp. W7]